MKAMKRVASMMLSACMLLGLIFVPTQAQQSGDNGSGFRGNAYNNGITTARTPQTKEGSGLLWEQKIGNYAGPPMYANGSVYTYWENKIYKLNKNTGKEEASGTIELDPSNPWAQVFGYTYCPVTYGDGKIYVGFGGGKIQAFDADTLKSEWIYTNESADKYTDAYSPITYKDGKIYTGFYKGWGSQAPTAFVCVSTQDGKEVWSKTEDGAFNWNGAAVAGDYVIYANTTGSIICRNTKDGEKADQLETGSAEIRASVTYDNGKIYCMTGDAKLVVADIDLSKGTFSDLKKIDCSEYGATSTSTLVVYNGIVYAGVGKSNSYGKVVAINPAEEKVLWSVDVTNYPQGSILLSNAYEKDGYLYLYVTYNKNPGGIDVVKAKADGTGAEEYELFGATAHPQYCIASIVADEEGTLYYKNDSGYVMAISESAGVENKVANLPAEKDLSLNDEKAIKEAREAYDALPDAQKALVSAETVKTLEKAEARICLLKTDKALGELPSAAKVTLENEKEVAEARKQYDALTRQQKKELSSEDVWNLFDAEKKIEKLKDEAEKAAKAEASAKDVQAAEKVEKQIMAIGTVTLSKVEKVTVTKAAYDKLTKAQKQLVSVEAIVTLKEAVAESNKYIKDTKTNAYYKVTKAGQNGTVSYIKPIVKKASAIIPAQITVAGYTYKVTVISAKAFNKNTAVQKVVIGKNISKIGKEAFYGCKNLKKIQIKSKKLSAKNVGSRAFKGINKKAKMSVPKSKVKSYAKWVKTKGSRSIKVTK